MTPAAKKPAEQRWTLFHHSSPVPNQCPHIEANLELVPPHILILRLAQSRRHKRLGPDLVLHTSFPGFLRSLYATRNRQNRLRNFTSFLCRRGPADRLFDGG